MGASLFSSHDYVRYRYGYPESLFHPLCSFIRPSTRNSTLQVLDLGCGTGLATRSFLKFFSSDLEIHLADPDTEMLQEAREGLKSFSMIDSVVCAPSEKLPFRSESMDLVLIGSAWHWMNAPMTMVEVEQVLRPNGGVFIFEYQFPKATAQAALNDWIRTRFNTIWKPRVQNPRGSLKELTKDWRDHSQFSQIASEMMVHDRSHDTKELAGVIASQSRYQHYEQSLPSSDRSTMRKQLESELAKLFSQERENFRYPYEAYLFKKRV